MKKLGKIVLILLAVIVVIALFNLNTIKLAFGGGKTNVQNFDKSSQEIKSSGLYENVNIQSKDGNQQILTGISKDNSTQISIISSGNKIEQVQAKVDAAK